MFDFLKDYPAVGVAANYIATSALTGLGTALGLNGQMIAGAVPLTAAILLVVWRCTINTVDGLIARAQKTTKGAEVIPPAAVTK